MTQPRYDCVVIGGGVTGHYLAKELANRGQAVFHVLGQRLGLLSQFSHGGFSFDLGGHVYTMRHPKLLEILSDCNTKRQERKAFYLPEQGDRIPFPVQNHPEMLGLSISPENVQGREPETLAEFGWATFGGEFAEQFFLPFNARQWAAQPSLMSCDWIRNRVKLPSENKVAWGPNADFMYARGDEIIGSIMNQAVDGGITYARQSVTRVDEHEKCIILANGTRVYYNTLFSTTLTPLTQFFYVPYLLGAVNTVLTFGVGFEDDHGLDFNWAYGDVHSSNIHRITNLSSYHDSLSPHGHSSIIVEIPYSHEMPRWAQRLFSPTRPIASSGRTYNGEDTPLNPKAVAGAIEQQLGIKFNGSPIVCEFAIFGGYPIPLMPVRHAVSELKIELAKHNIYTAGRWGSHGYFNLDHCIDDADAALGYAFDHDMIKAWEYQSSNHYYGTKEA